MGESRESVAARWAALPLGELHAEGVCAFCGLSGHVDGRYPTLRRTVLAMTRATAHVCIDVVGCERRREVRRRRA